MNLDNELVAAQAETIRALDGEPVILEDRANLQRGWEAVGGWLAFSLDRLVFTPHRFNVRKAQLLVSVADIRCVYPCWTWLFGLLPVVPNSMAVETFDGEVHRFVVWDRQRWIAGLGLLTDEPPIGS